MRFVCVLVSRAHSLDDVTAAALPSAIIKTQKPLRFSLYCVCYTSPNLYNILISFKYYWGRPWSNLISVSFSVRPLGLCWRFFINYRPKKPLYKWRFDITKAFRALSQSIVYSTTHSSVKMVKCNQCLSIWPPARPLCVILAHPPTKEEKAPTYHRQLGHFSQASKGAKKIKYQSDCHYATFFYFLPKNNPKNVCPCVHNQSADLCVLS